MTENLASSAGLWFVRLLITVPAILLSLTFHELAHGMTAYAFGDPTAKERGRLTLNPIRHLDPMGTILFFIAGFGWAKPVPVNGHYFQRPRRDMALVSLAGPATNFTLAALTGLVLSSGLVGKETLSGAFVQYFMQINIVLGVFNLLPMPPLDGSRLVSALLPERLLVHYERIEGYGLAIIFAVVFFLPGGLFKLIGPVVNFFNRLFLV